jgi:hypothetical protein
VEVHESARRHQIAEADIAHAVAHCVYSGQIDDPESPPWRILYLGPDRATNMLEVVVIERDDGTEIAIHAMKMRKKYRSWLGGGG